MVDTLRSKARAWEKERKVEFLYDGVCTSLGLRYSLCLFCFYYGQAIFSSLICSISSCF